MEITTEIKEKLADALDRYIEDNELTQTQAAKLTGVNAAYLIQIKRRDFTINSGGKAIPIADRYFRAIADTIDFPLEKVYWETRPTMQTKEILAHLADAKKNAEPVVIIGETGSGKSYTAELFRRKHPIDTFIVKVGSTDNLRDLLDKVLAHFDVPFKVLTRTGMINQIIWHMNRLRQQGYNPQLLFDEAEYLNVYALCAWKELFDNLNNVCSLGLIGTDQLIEKLDKLRMRNKAGIPQLYRRIKYRIRKITPIDRTYRAFITDYPVPLQKWLKANCDNYGELHDVMETALREADRTGKELNEDFVKLVLGI